MPIVDTGTCTRPLHTNVKIDSLCVQSKSGRVSHCTSCFLPSSHHRLLSVGPSITKRISQAASLRDWEFAIGQKPQRRCEVDCLICVLGESKGGSVGLVVRVIPSGPYPVGQSVEQQETTTLTLKRNKQGGVTGVCRSDISPSITLPNAGQPYFWNWCPHHLTYPSPLPMQGGS